MRCGQVDTSGKYFWSIFLPVEFGHGQLPVKVSVHNLCISLYPWSVSVRKIVFGKSCQFHSLWSGFLFNIAKRDSIFCELYHLHVLRFYGNNYCKWWFGGKKIREMEDWIESSWDELLEIHHSWSVLILVLITSRCAVYAQVCPVCDAQNTSKTSNVLDVRHLRVILRNGHSLPHCFFFMFFVFVSYLSIYSHVFKQVSLKDAWNVASLTPWRPTLVTPVLRTKTTECWRPYVTLQSTGQRQWPSDIMNWLANQMHHGTGQSDALWDRPVGCTMGLACQMHRGTGQ